MSTDKINSNVSPTALAPDFRLPSTPDQFVSLREFRGSPVILAFYPADWSLVCGDQMGLYNEVLPEFRRFTQHCSASRSMALGATWPLPTTASYSSCCLPTLSPKVWATAPLACIARTTASASAHFL
jgi:hypothetical protein